MWYYVCGEARRDMEGEKHRHRQDRSMWGSDATRRTGEKTPRGESRNAHQRPGASERAKGRAEERARWTKTTRRKRATTAEPPSEPTRVIHPPPRPTETSTAVPVRGPPPSARPRSALTIQKNARQRTPRMRVGVTVYAVRMYVCAAGPGGVGGRDVIGGPRPHPRTRGGAGGW